MPITTQTYRPTLNSGQVYLRVAGSAAPLKPIGNVSVLQLAISEDEKSLTDHTQPGGGQWAAVSRVTGVEASMTLHDLDSFNLSRAIYGSTSDAVSGAVTGELATAYQGGLIRTAKPNPTAVVVTYAAPVWAATHAYALNATLVASGKRYKATTAGTSGASAPTWPASGTVTDGTVVWTFQGAWAPVEGTDYEVRKEGLLILGGAILDGDGISLAYSYAAYSVVEALTTGSLIYELSFGGLNEADNNSPVILDIYKLKISAAKAIDFIGDDFASLEVTGKVLMDATKTGAGVSKYFRVQMA